MSRRRSILLITSAVVLVGAVASWAFLTAIGSGAGDVNVDSLGNPDPVTASTPTTGAAHLTWSLVTSPSGTAADVTYTVDRSGNAGATWTAANNTCAGSLAQATVSCDDQPPADGDYVYRVTAHFRTWTASGVSNSVHVVVAVATKLVFTTAPQTLTAGSSSGTITIQRQTASNAPYTSGATTVTLTSNAPTGTFRDVADAATITSVTIVNGTSTASFRYRDTIAGSPTITASATGLTAATQAATVNAGPAATLNLVAATTTPTAGAADNLSVTAADTYGNTATSYSGDKALTFAGASPSPAGTTPTVTNKTGTAVNFGSSTVVTFTNGFSTVSAGSNGVMKLYKAETASIIVSDGSINNGAGLSVTVSPATAASLTLAAASTTPTAGTADNLSITAKDAYGNVATSYTGSKNLTFGGATSIGSFIPTVTNSSGTASNFGTMTTISFTNGVSSVSGSNNGVMKLYKAETASITVSDGTVNNGTGSPVTVSAAAASTFTLANCILASGNNADSSVACSTPWNLGNNPGHMRANVEIIDAYGNVPAATSVTITISSSNANYTVSGSPVTVTGSGSPVNRSSSQFTVTHANNASNTATITVSATGFTSITFDVQK